MRMVGRGMTVFARQAEGPATPLSPREREVLELIGAGATNREIAERLFLYPTPSRTTPRPSTGSSACGTAPRPPAKRSSSASAVVPDHPRGSTPRTVPLNPPEWGASRPRLFTSGRFAVSHQSDGRKPRLCNPVSGAGRRRRLEPRPRRRRSARPCSISRPSWLVRTPSSGLPKAPRTPSRRSTAPRSPATSSSDGRRRSTSRATRSARSGPWRRQERSMTPMGCASWSPAAASWMTRLAEASPGQCSPSAATATAPRRSPSTIN